MLLSGLTRRVALLDSIVTVARQTGSSRVFGLLGSARPAVVAAVQQAIASPLLVVTGQPQDAADLAHDLQYWTESRIDLFPAFESLPYERAPLDRTLLSRRETVLRELATGSAGVIVTPIRSLLQPVRRPNSAGVRSAEVRVGDRFRVEELLSTWVSMGYASVGMVDEQGTFARRGGVIDVFPAGADNPVRIEFFGPDVESLRVFDPSSQRSISSLEHITIHQVATLDEASRLQALERLLAVDTSNLNAAAETAWLEDLGRLEAGASADELAVFAPYLLGRDTGLVDHLPENAVILVDHRPNAWDVMRDLCEQAAEVQRELVESGNLPASLEPALLDLDEISTRLAQRRWLEFFPGTGTQPGDLDWSHLFAPARLYAGRIRSAVADLAAARRDRTVITSFQHERVAELLAEEEIGVRRLESLDTIPEPGISLLPVSLSAGWSSTALGISVLSDHELFGRARTRPVQRQRRASRDAIFAGFSPGDHVVHLEHGIGRFEGVTRMSIDGAEREYALVQYAGTDRVYVPTDQLERLTRYIGVGESAPPLNKLGGGEWQRARARAKQAAAEIAGELIDVYSKRMAREAHAFAPDAPWQHELESSFPYPETPDQLQAVEDVKADMEADRPMDRLVCADVGYGKTEVAVRAAFKAIMDGRQVAILVPTTILAQQHFETFSERFAGFPVRVEALSRFRSAAEHRDVLRRLAAGEVDVLIGTHRILSKDVHFKNLGLLIVDEEQRFGVRHKEELKKLRESIDVLTLTATPIPRTLHMGLVGIREISIIETPPEGRLPIKTYLQPLEDRLIREAVLRELDRDGQVYLVHNKVVTIEAMAERIRRLVPEARVVVAHGQMDDALLEKVMFAFAHREADVLVCSTIIENGMDLPNVNTIVVNNAHRLGLTQLYQLRGRVGRSANQAYAYLLYPQDVHLSHDAMRRLEAVFEAQELGAGMNIAMKDLEIRGVGNLLGAEQSGHAVAIGFDLYTRMIGEAVERLRGMPVEERSPITIDLPLTMFLPADYVGSESERLTIYRRLAAVDTRDELDALAAELSDRFGAPPPAVQNLITSVQIKLAAAGARVISISLSREALIVRAEPSGLYDRVALYRKYGSEARISTNVLRIPRHLVGDEWLAVVQEILGDMTRLRESLGRPQPVGA